MAKKVIVFAGDIHGDITKMYKYLKALQEQCNFKIDYLIHVGDFGIYKTGTDFQHYIKGERKAPFPTYVCPGNHEEWPVVALWKENPDDIPNIHLMPDGEVTEIPIGEAKLRVGTIWGNYSYKSYKNPERIHSVRKRDSVPGFTNHSNKANHVEKAAVDRLLTKGKIDVLITHDCPQGMAPVDGQPPQFIKDQLGIDVDETCAGCHGFNEIHKVNQPDMHFFGHFHVYKVVKERGPRVTALHCFNYNMARAFEFWEVEDTPDGRIEASQFDPYHNPIPEEGTN